MLVSFTYFPFSPAMFYETDMCYNPYLDNGDLEFIFQFYETDMCSNPDLDNGDLEFIFQRVWSKII